MHERPPFETRGSSPHKRPPARRGVSRRDVLKGLGATALVAAGGVTVKKLLEERTGVAPETPPTPEAIAHAAEGEIRRAEAILERGEAHRVLESRFLAAALYHSDEFLRSIVREGPSTLADRPARRILAQLAPRITPALRVSYFEWLSDEAKRSLGASAKRTFTAPLADFEFGRRGVNHADAVDLFVKEEGVEVRSVTRGVVVLAEDGWTPEDPLSTTSPLAGNSVIVFDPDAHTFYRYSHLASVAVEAGVVVRAGTPLGAVGHSGINASREGYGKHLHLEANRYDPQSRSMRQVLSRELKRRLSRVEK